MTLYDYCRSFLSGIDVTALLPRFPMLGHEPYETRFQGGTEIRGFNQIEKFLGHNTPQNKLYCFSEKKKLRARCTLIFSIWATQNRKKERRRKKDTLVCLINGYHNTSHVDLKEGKGGGEPLSSILDDVK